MRLRPNIVGGILATVWLLVIVIPVYLAIRASIESQSAYAKEGPIGLPTMFTLDNYVGAFKIGFGGFLLNSAIIAAGTVVIVVLVVTPLAFAIVRSRSRLVRISFRVMLVGLAIPAQVVVLPVYFLIYQVGLYDTLIGVILPTAAFAIPISALILLGSMREISGELYEAMAIDGASSWRMFRRLVVPLSRGGIGTIVVYTALQAWNGFLLPLILTRSQSVTVATVGLNNFQGNHTLNIPGLMAAIILTIIPIFFLYLFARRSLIAGLTGMGGK